MRFASSWARRGLDPGGGRENVVVGEGSCVTNLQINHQWTSLSIKPEPLQIQRVDRPFRSRKLDLKGREGAGRVKSLRPAPAARR
jgi:hypothetical protein